MPTYAIDFDNTITGNEISGKAFNKGLRPLSWLITKGVSKDMESLSVNEKRQLIMENLNAKNIETDVSCLAELREFVIAAIKNGHRVAIVTFSDARSAVRMQTMRYKEGGWVAGELLIEAYLRIIFKKNPEIIDQVIIKAEIPLEDEPQNKNKQLIKLFEETQQKVLLFDDSVVNVNAANEAKDEHFEAVLVNNTEPKLPAKTLAQHLQSIQLQRNEFEVNAAVLGASLAAVTNPTSNLRCSDELRKSGEEVVFQPPASNELTYS